MVNAGAQRGVSMRIDHGELIETVSDSRIAIHEGLLGFDAAVGRETMNRVLQQFKALQFWPEPERIRLFWTDRSSEAMALARALRDGRAGQSGPDDVTWATSPKRRISSADELERHPIESYEPDPPPEAHSNLDRRGGWPDWNVDPERIADLTDAERLRETISALDDLRSFTAVHSRLEPAALIHDTVSALLLAIRSDDKKTLGDLHKVARKLLVRLERENGRRLVSTEVQIVSRAEFVQWLRRMIDGYKNGSIHYEKDETEIATSIFYDRIVGQGHRAYPEIAGGKRYYH
jgi:hypothetical protein